MLLIVIYISITFYKIYGGILRKYHSYHVTSYSETEFNMLKRTSNLHIHYSSIHNARAWKHVSFVSRWKDKDDEMHTTLLCPRICPAPPGSVLFSSQEHQHMTKQHLPFSFLPISSAEMLANKNHLEQLQNSEVKRTVIIKTQEKLFQRIKKV